MWRECHGGKWHVLWETPCLSLCYARCSRNSNPSMTTAEAPANGLVAHCGVGRHVDIVEIIFDGLLDCVDVRSENALLFGSVVCDFEPSYGIPCMARGALRFRTMP